MALRSVMHSHPCRNYPLVMGMDFHRIPPGSAKDLNSHRDSALAIRRRPAALSFSDQAVSARRRDSVMGRTAPAAAVYCASPSSADPFDSRDFVPVLLIRLSLIILRLLLILLLFLVLSLFVL